MTGSNRGLDSHRRGGLKVAFRLARRNAQQAPGRSILIAALIAIPVIGLAGLATVVTSMLPTVQETLRTQLGHSQAMLQMVSPPDPSLVQSPNEPAVYQFDNGVNGPLHHKETAPVVVPDSFLPGVRILSVRETSVTVRTAHGTGSLSALEGEPWDKSFAGKYDRATGRVPVIGNEIMASPAALKRLGVHLGDTVTVLLPKPATVTVVGTLVDRSQPTHAQILFAFPAALDGVAPESDLAGTQFYLPDTPVSWAMVQKLNHSGAVVLSRDVLLNPPLASQTTIAAQDAYIPWTQLTIAFPLAGFALFEVALLAGAAFMVGARREQRSLATLASVGGDRRMLFQVIAFGGVVLGVIGGVVGSGLGVFGAWLYINLSSDGSATEYPGFHANPFVLAGVILFAALAGLFAAAIPARVASRVDVVAALRGALRPPRVTMRRPVVGIVLAAIGAGITLIGGAICLIPQAPNQYEPVHTVVGLGLVVVGPIVMQVGAILLAPLILRWISRLLANFGLGARLGSRDASRNSSRSVPALAAIMTTIFVGSFIMTFISSSEAEGRAGWDYWTKPNLASADLAGWRPNGKLPTTADAQRAASAIESTFHVKSARVLSTAVERVLESATAADNRGLFATPALVNSTGCPQGVFLQYSGPFIAAPTCARAPYDLNQTIWVGDAADLSLALGKKASAVSRQTLASGGVVALYPQYVRNGSATIEWRTGSQQNRDQRVRKTSAAVRSVTLPATVQTPGHDYKFAVFISPATARSLGISFAPSLVLAPVSGPPTDAQYDTLNAAAVSITGGDVNNIPMYFRVEPGPPNTSGSVAWILLAICALIALGAAAVAIGLARADGRRDDYVLGATGASPRLRRSFGFWQAVCLAGTGAIIGVALGIVPVLALSLSPAATTVGGLLFSPPWVQLALAAVAVPVVIASGTWLLSRGGQRSLGSTALARA
ncbi:MAG: putative transport system permease protein, partial [Actinomycetota bacterium]|nr:putative transport system permease protein [Actinomycetota bacterium]